MIDQFACWSVILTDHVGNVILSTVILHLVHIGSYAF